MPARTTRLVASAVLLLCVYPGAVSGADLKVGVAAVDVTPNDPVRLSGFGFRRAESEGVTQRIWAKAIAFEDGGADGPAVLVCVDNLGVPLAMTRQVAARIGRKTALKPDRLAIAASHTHTAPMLTGVAPTLFGMPIPPDQQVRIDRYTRRLTDDMEKVALAALADLKPARVEFAVGTWDLAANRRTKGGPVDHDLPVVVVRDPAASGTVRAVYASYACHCVTLSDNRISGDWAGFAQEALQKKYPGAVALISIGCGADANPKSGVTGDKTDVAAAQGSEMADAVERTLAGGAKPIAASLATRSGEVELLFDTPPTREQWQETAKRDDAAGYHARVNLARLARGEKLQETLPYPIRTWAFGDQLALVFLPGEVVVDYALRLKKEFDGSRLSVVAYANDAPCYIPSERILKEGGYEGGGAMVYYDRPTRLAPGLEDKIIAEVRRQLPPAFLVTTAAAAAAAPEPRALAAIILDPSNSNEIREAAVNNHPTIAAELIQHMTRDLAPGKAEYDRIPWIWRVAVACGRRNDAAQMKRVLAVSVPQDGQPLRDWQAVVIGGGIINGVSDKGHWPAKRIAEVLANEPALLKHYQRSLDLASAMADDEKVPVPTRYDALRMLGVEPWEKRGAQLTRYLAKGTHEELQMGAVSGIVDVDSPQATAALVAALPGLAEANRNLALDGLLRDESRAAALLDAVEAGKVDKAALGTARVDKLTKHPNERLRQRAAKLLTQT